LKKGHNSVRERQIKKISLYTQLITMCDNPRTFNDHPMNIVGGKVMLDLHQSYFNLILTTGEVPTQWSGGIIVPIYKK